MAQFNNTVSLAHGVPTKLTNAGQITGPGTLLFTLPGNPGSAPVNALFQAIGVLTGLTSTLQADLSGSTSGTNLATYVASRSHRRRAPRRRLQRRDHAPYSRNSLRHKHYHFDWRSD